MQVHQNVYNHMKARSICDSPENCMYASSMMVQAPLSTAKWKDKPLGILGLLYVLKYIVMGSERDNGHF